jgi:DNA-binding SARP family transcriptional activator
MPRFTLTLLGGFGLRCEDRGLTTAPATQRLLAFVATRSTTVSRAATAQALWPRTSGTRAAANLRSALWRLRNEQDEGPIRCTPNGLRLSPDTTVDMYTVHAQTTGLFHASGTDAYAGATPGEDVMLGLEPAALRHDVLPDWSEEWLLSTREWFRQVRLHALEALCLEHCRHGRFSAALEAGMAAVACEPLRESAHRAVVRVHLSEGNPAEALRQYRMYRHLLHAELGLSPSEQFRALLANLRAPATRTVRTP